MRLELCPAPGVSICAQCSEGARRGGAGEGRVSESLLEVEQHLRDVLVKAFKDALQDAASQL